jgi:hypothetical protein
MRHSNRRLFALALLAFPATLAAQTFRSADTVIKKMWQVGMEQSQTEKLAQVLVDSIGPRLSGTQGFANAVDWLEKTYTAWGVPVRREKYGTWRGWRQGTVHMEMIGPRFQNLEVKLLAWSPPTPKNGPVEGDVVVIPDLADSVAAKQWLGTLRGKFVLVSAPEIMCRAPQELERYARPATVTKINQQRVENQRAAAARFRALAPGAQPQDVFRTAYARLDSSGVIGVGTLTWSGGWGVDKIFGSNTQKVPSVDISCEDFGLLYRLATNKQGPRVRLTVESQATPAEVPMFDVVAELKGTELPNEYVLLSAHLDSWHGATGATDNGTGTLTMLEAMRILKETYPHPRRTILAGHWGGEEQGTIGSLAFAEDPAAARAAAAICPPENCPRATS